MISNELRAATPIGLLLANPIDAKLLGNFLASMGHAVSVLSEARQDLAGRTDNGLIIADEVNAERHVEHLMQVKRRADPFLLPMLVLAKDKADAAFWVKRGFDDMLRMPLVKAELMVRLETFLRLREASVRAHRESEERFRMTFNEAPSGIAHTAPDGRMLMVNRCLCDMLGYSESELLELRSADITLPGDLDATQNSQRPTAGKAGTGSVETRYVRKDGSVFWGELLRSALRDDRGNPTRFICIITEISGRKALEGKLEGVARARRFMAECNRVLVHATEESALLAQMCREAVRSGGYRMAWVGKAQQDARKSVIPVASAGEGVEFLGKVFVSWSADDAAGGGPTGRAIRSGELTVVGDIASDPTTAPWHANAAEHGLRSVVVLPLKVGADTVGSLSIYAHEVRLLSEDERELLNELAADISYGIEALRTRQAHAASELALRESERFARSTLDALPKHICVLDETGTIIATNRSWRNYSASVGCGRGPQVHEAGNYLEICDRAALTGAAEAAPVAGAIRAALAGSDEDFVLEYPCHSPTEQHWFLLRINRFTEQGPPRVVVSHEDVTVRHQMADSVRRSEERFKSLTKLSSDWYWEQDEEFRFTLMSGAMLDVRWPNHSLMIGKTRWEMNEVDAERQYMDMTPEKWQAHKAVVEAHLPFRDLESQQRAPDGQIQYIRVSGEPIFDEHGTYRGYRGTGKYITEQKRAEHALLEARERMSFLLSATPAVIFAHQAVAPYAPTFISDNVRNQFGYEPEEILAAPAANRYEHIHPEDLPRFLAGLPKVFDGGRHRIEYRFQQKDGAYVWVQEEVRLARSMNGAESEIVGYLIDISEKKRVEEQLLHLAHYDALTALPNRMLFYDRLTHVVAHAERHQRSAGVLFIDLDRFKIVNDTLGHGVGDELLRCVSARLGKTVRTGDTVGRLGGDEFAIILGELSNAEDAQVVAKKIMKTFEQPFEVNGREMFVTASVGIAVYPSNGRDPDSLIKNADIAMYRAKDAGGNSIRFYAADMNSRALEKLELEHSLRRALERGEFLLHYQPKVSARSGKVTGMEALLRWARPGHGLISPADFIPILEETGLIVPVGEWVLRAACEQIKVSTANGLRPVPIAVNLSARQLESAALPGMVRGIFEESGVDPALIELEITESSLMHNAEEAGRLLNELKKTGLRISIDDFGTGYSSLAYLKRFRVDTLKIDRTFVRDVNIDENDAAIARAIITMAHQLSLKVVAEGVETKEQLAFLINNGCDEAQGFLFSRPLPADQLRNLPMVYLVTV